MSAFEIVKTCYKGTEIDAPLVTGIVCNNLDCDCVDSDCSIGTYCEG